MEEKARNFLLNIEDNYVELTDPYSELARLAQEVLGLKNVLRAKVEELANLKDYGGERVMTQIDVVMAAYERALDRAERLLLGISRLDLDGKIAALQARVDSETASLVATALVDALGSAQVPSEFHAEVLKVFGERLRGPEMAVLAQ